MNKNKILMIINEFPPTGGSSIQRPLKFAKYAVKAGWEVHIIAPQKPVRKVLDYSLLKDIPTAAIVHRVAGLGIKNPENNKMVDARFAETAPKSKIFKSFWGFLKLVNDFIFPYDKQIGWMPFAYFTACNIIKKQQIRNIYITAYPYSAFLVGIALKKKFRESVFWVADYRDSWQFKPLLEKFVLPFRLRKICKTDDKVLATCDAAVFVTPETRLEYINKHSWLKEKSYYIPNGFDEDDFTGVTPKKFDKLTLVLMGKLTKVYGSPLNLLEVLQESFSNNYQVIHIGNIEKAILQSIKNAGYTNYHYLGYQKHSEAIAYSLGADINLILLNEHSTAKYWFPGKLFELLRCGKPILALGPKESNLEKILSDTKRGRYAYINDKEQIKAQLKYILENPNQFDTSLETIKQYSREELCKQLLAIYERGQSSSS
ncbi:MAG TPA: hypothetical protein PLK65_00415 [Candidatus Cloacimonas sp.]|nr:hypothetical protein [Candidatus Cloacimonas sp.]HQM03401.1 hypothetical protein [Candidatus Cloacimonas sp.]